MPDSAGTAEDDALPFCRTQREAMAHDVEAIGQLLDVAALLQRLLAHEKRRQLSVDGVDDVGLHEDALDAGDRWRLHEQTGFVR